MKKGLILLSASLLLTLFVHAQCPANFSVTRNPLTTLCSPQTVTLLASYDGTDFFRGEFRWYNSQSGGTLLQSNPVRIGQNRASYTFFASGTMVIWVCYYNSMEGCESYRTPYVVAISSAPSILQNYARSCGRGNAEIQVSSTTGSIVFELYKFEYPSEYHFVGSNSTGHFSISNFDPANPGIYFVKGSQAYGCPSVYTPIYIDVASPAPPTVSGNRTICEGGQTTLTASGSPGTYRWYDAAGTLLYEGAQFTTGASLAPGTYNYTVVGVNPNTCTTDPASFSITVNPKAVDGTIYASATTICLGQSVTISSAGGLGTPYYWCSNNGIASWNIFAADHVGQYSFVHTPTTAGTYYYYLRNQGPCGFCWDWGGCGPDKIVTVTVVGPPDPPTVSGGTTFCTGTLTTLIASGNANSYRWYDPSDNFMYEGTQLTFGAGLAPGSYYYKVRAVNAGMCVSAPAYVLLTVNPKAIDGNITASASTICLGQSVTISSSGGLGTPHYWCSNNGIASWNIFAQAHAGEYSFVHTPTAPGVYYYYLRNQGPCGFCWDLGGCGPDKIVTVTVVDNPSPPTVSGTTSFCHGAPTTLTASGNANSYRWYDAADNFLYEGTNFTFGSNLAVGTYTYRVRGINAGMCLSAPTNFSITINPNTANGVLSVSATTICLGQSVTIRSSGGIGAPYYWCTSNGGASWNVFEMTYGGQYSFVHTPTAPGVYRYHLLNYGACGFCWDYGSVCGPEQNIDVTVVGPPPPPTISGSTTLCTGAPTTLSGSSAGASIYRWYDVAGNFLYEGTNFTFGANLAPGSYTYKVRAINPWGCISDPSTFTIIVNARPVDGTLTASATTICLGQSVTITRSGSTGTPYYWCSSDGGNNYDVFSYANVGMNSFVHTPATAGVYRYHMRNQGVCGFCWDNGGTCTTFPYVDVTVVAPPAAPTVSGTTAFCTGTQTTLTASGGANSYRWYNAADNFLYEGTQFTTGAALAPGSYTYKVRAVNAGICVSNPTPFTLIVDQKPVDGTITASATTICLGQAVTINSSGGVGVPYYWCSNNGGTSWNIFQVAHGGQSSFQDIPTAVGTYRYLIHNKTTYCGFCYDGGGQCAAYSYVDVTVVAIPAAPTVSGTTSFCVTNQTTLTASGNASSYRWYDAADNLLSTGTQYTFGSNLAAGTYTYRVRGINAGLCLSAPTTFTITVNPKAIDGNITASATAICLGQSVTISSSGGLGTPHYWCSSNGMATWNIFAQTHAGEYSFVHTPTAAGTYYYYLRNQGPCGFCWDLGGCGPDKIVTVTVSTPPVVAITIGRPPSGPGVVLTASISTGSFQWMLNNVAIAGATASTYAPVSAGSYSVRLTTALGCQAVSGAVIIQESDLTTENYVRTWEPTAPETNPDLLMTRPLRDVKQTTAYFDGLGRPKQTVIKQASQGKDIVTPVVYDQFGREVMKYIPYVDLSSDGSYKINPIVAQTSFMQNQFVTQGETYFYNQTNYEASPLNRISKTMAAGNSWVGSGRGTTTKYLLNTAIDEVRIWGVTNSTSPGIYATGTLIKNITIDEDNKQIIEFKNNDGKLILKKMQVSESVSDNGNGSNHNGWLCTYYIYDDINQLRAVVQPKAVEAMSTSGAWTLDPAKVDELCFRYDYDQKGRTIMKKVPGAGSVYMVYDARDRMVMTQDGNLRAQSKWMVTIYDEQNRPVATGIWSNANSFSIHISAANTSTVYPFSSNPAPSGAWEPLTETHYDNYDGLPAGLSSNLSMSGYVSYLNAAAGSPEYAEPVTASLRTKGLVTWTRIKVLGENNYLSSVNIYDDRGKLTQVQFINYTGGLDVTTNQYSFSGQLLRSHIRHQKLGGATQTNELATKITYDDLGRVVKTEKNINNTGWKAISQVDYDALGQLKNKKLAPDLNSGQGLENLTYDYNIRGWMLGANREYVKSASATSNYFGFDLGYDKTQIASLNGGTIGSFVRGVYNGNITGMVWKSTGDDEIRKYDFSYDVANRLTGADFNQYSGGAFTKNAGIDFSVSGLAYDANGNIGSITQKGWRPGSSSAPIDQLSYNYLPGSNKLAGVTDAFNDNQSKLGDFKYDPAAKTGVDYFYDSNGNLTSDQNKKISSVAYNYLNLPQTITITGKGSIEYTYDAAGNKLKKIVHETGKPDKTTLYLAGVYEDDVLQFLSQEEGRIRYKPETSSFVYDYFLRDHLDNVRMVLTEDTKTDAYPAATMETDAATTQELLYSNLPQTRTDKPQGYPYDPYLDPNSKVAKVRGDGQKFGPAIVLKVMAGDKFNMRVSSWYRLNGTAPSPSVNPLNELANALSNSLGNIGGKTSTQELNSSNIFQNGLPGFFTQQNNNAGPGKPKAYVNWILFDEQFKPVITNDGRNTGVLQVGNENELTNHILNGREITKNGYLYIYVSNETPNIDVFFDNLQVTHIHGPVLEETHYYPFGLTMAGISSKALAFGSPENKKKYDSYEQTTDLDLNVYESFYRTHDQQIGRFWQIDPKPDEMISPYAAMNNNPVKYFDPLGDTLKVFVADQIVRPQDNGVAGKTYTAYVYIFNTETGILSKRYSGSSFPNSKSPTDNTTDHKTIKEGTYLYNNLYGHDKSTKQGLNLVDANGDRNTPGFDRNGKDVNMTEINVHEGKSDNGGYQSRGSKGCITINPKDAEEFFAHFNWTNRARTTGNSTGTIEVIRIKDPTAIKSLPEVKIH